MRKPVSARQGTFAGAEEGAILKNRNIINGLRLASATPANEDANDKAS
jgi:hypothetical protein